MSSPLHRLLLSRRELFVIATTSSTVAIGFIFKRDSSDYLLLQSKFDHSVFNVSPCACDSVQDPSSLQQQDKKNEQKHTPISSRPELHARDLSPSIWSRLLAPIGILSLPRLLTPNDPAFKVSKRFLRKRQNDEEKIRKLVMEDAPKAEPKVDTKPTPAPTVDTDDGDTMSYFEKLANE